MFRKSFENTSRTETGGTVRRLLITGAVVTGVLALLPVLDLLSVDSIGDHVRDAYPAWDSATIAKDRNAIASYLVMTGLLGVIGWLGALWASRRPNRTGRGLAAALLLMGATITLTNLSMGGGHYDTIIPMTYAAGWVIPLIIGIAACVQIWRNAGYVDGRAS